MLSRLIFITVFIGIFNFIGKAEDSISVSIPKQKMRIKVLPNGYYRPETRIALGGFVLLTFKPNLRDTISRWSYLKSTFIGYPK